MSILDQIKKTVYIRKNKEVMNVVEADRDPKKVAVKRLGQSLKGQGGDDFEESPVDLEEIGRAYFTDSYIRRAVDKHSTLMFKNGWKFSGKNDDAVEYVRTRMKLMSEGTGMSTEALVQEIGENLVLYANCYIVKARAKNNSVPSGIQAQGYTGKQPIAGYFILPAQQVTISRDDNGTILAYQQEGDGGDAIEFKPTEVVHFTYRQPTGRAYGVPFIFNALDDVKLLRQIEENVARLIYRNLFPLYLYKVGIDKPGFEATDEEIDELRNQIREIPMDGALVVPERHNIEVIGSAGEAIDANGYLRYFRERVFSGLNASDTTMGISDTSNKSTSDNQSADLNDSVKYFQQIFANHFKFHVINELLFEGGYDPILNEEDEVSFNFSEIEFDAKTKRENHIIQMYMQNAIVFEEMRELLGREKEVDESRLYVNLFNNPVHSSDDAGKTGDNKDQPENQHGKKTGPGEPKRSKEKDIQGKVSVSESIELTNTRKMVSLQESLGISSFTKELEGHWSDALEDTQNMFRQGDDTESIIMFAVKAFEGLIKEKASLFSGDAFIFGYKEGLTEGNFKNQRIKEDDLNICIEKHKDSFDNLIQDISETIKKARTEESPEAFISHAFTANRFRLAFTVKRIAYESFNYGVALSAQKEGRDKVFVKMHDSSCEECQSAPHEITLSDGWRESIPPHHLNCECEIVLTDEEVM